MILQIATVDVGNQIRHLQDGRGVSMAWVIDPKKLADCRRVEFVDLTEKRTRLVADIDHEKTHRMVEEGLAEYAAIDTWLTSGHGDRWPAGEREQEKRLLEAIEQGRVVLYYTNAREVNWPPRAKLSRNPVRYCEET